uniref:BTB domain-containing protein n=1 Tax=Oryza punctata TaxID=4537 RepID=A0A0E0KH70_ORYPU
METSTITFSSSSPPSPPPQPAPGDIDAVSLDRLSKNLEHLLDPAFLNCADAEIVLASGGGDPGGGAAVGVHRCILAARSRFFYDHFSSAPAPAAAGEKPQLDLDGLVPGGRHIGRDALVAVLGYLYTGRLRSAPPEAAVCLDDGCSHDACRPAIDFVIESTYAASGFQISELVSLFQRRLSDFVNKALAEDILPILLVASTCQLPDLLNQCIQRVANSNLDNRYLEKRLPDDLYTKLKEFRVPDELHTSILDPEHEKRVRNIHKALDSDDVDLVGMLLKESPVTLDDAFAIHYAAAYCEPKVLAELLKLDSANVNLKNSSGYTPLHMACMRREPDIIVSLIEKGASVLERTQDGRDALTICKRLTREKDRNEKSEKCKERSKAYLCIGILQQEIKRKQFILEDQMSAEESIATPLLVDNFHMRLLNLENRVAFARIFFPSEAKLVMRIAQADSTEEFAGLTSANFSKLKEVDLNETPTMQNRRLRERLDALTKTVELGRRYFPHCSEVLDKFLNEESTDLFFLESGTTEDQQTKRQRFSELREDVRKAFTKDKAAGAAISSSISASSSPRYETKLRPGNKKWKLSR